jgi:hypothetical protein
MSDFLIGLIGTVCFGFVGFFLFEKNKTTEKFFGDKQNSIYISIIFFIFGMYLSHEGITRKILFVEQIGFSAGVYLVAFSGAVLATFIGMGFNFSFKNRKFLYSLNSAIIISTVLYML